MTGMKEGAGEDPFAEDEDDEQIASEPENHAGVEDTQPPPESVSKSATAQQSRQRQIRIPYKFRRDSVQDGRERVPLFLHSDIKSIERDAQRELEDRFDDDVSLTDLREALVKVGLQHLDDVEAQMEEWGYGMTFEE